MTDNNENRKCDLGNNQLNNEIIDNLVKEFETQELTADDNTNSIFENLDEEPIIIPDTLSEGTAEELQRAEDEFRKENKYENPFDDFIDEEAMKEAEENITEEEKEKRKEEAEVIKQDGNKEFKNGNYLESVNLYTKALRLCPLCYEIDRAILYSNRAASKQKLDKKECAVDDCTKAIVLYPTYLKPLMRRAKLYEELDKLDESLEDYKKIEALDQSNIEVRRSIRELSLRIEERNEKMKEEMIGKLKDLGNVILKPFGLSTNNFQLNKDPNTGGYSINFCQNK